METENNSEYPPLCKIFYLFNTLNNFLYGGETRCLII